MIPNTSISLATPKMIGTNTPVINWSLNTKVQIDRVEFYYQIQY